MGNQEEQKNQKVPEEKSSAEKPRPGQVIKPQSQIEEEKREKAAAKIKEEAGMGKEGAEETSSDKTPPAKTKQPQEKPDSQEPVIEEAPIKEEAAEKEPKRSKAKLPIVPLIILILIIGLGAGGYFAYSNGFLDGIVNGSMNLFQNGEEEPAPPAPVTQEQPSTQVDQTKTLDYLEEQLEELEDPVGALERNSNLRIFLNLDGSEL